MDGIGQVSLVVSAVEPEEKWDGEGERERERERTEE